MMANTPHTNARVSPRWAWLWGALGLAAVVAGFHGRAVTHGLFLDDWAHYTQLQEAGWTLQELVAACRLELNGGVLEAWWIPEVTLRFFRPVSFAVLKAVYTLSGWSPEAAHIASVCWHFVVCVLLWRLIVRLGIRPWQAWAATALFAFHPAHVPTVQWIASQTELVVSMLVLGAMHCYLSLRGWQAGRFGAQTDAAEHEVAEPGALRAWLWGGLGLALFALAMGSRENAVMLPFVLLAVEPWLGRRGRGRAIVWLVLAGALMAGYLWLRSVALGGMALPPRPYVVPPSDSDFLLHVVAKAAYYVLGEYLLVPCVPLGGISYLQQAPLLLWGATIVVLFVLGVFVWMRRGRLIAWLAPVCLLGFMAPVLPAFESPHHLYLPGIGWAMSVALGLDWWLESGKQRRVGRVARLSVFGVVALATTLLFATFTHLSSETIDAAQTVEDAVIREVATAPDALEDGDTIVFANLPMIAHYVKHGVESRTGLRDLRVVALTWAPHLLQVRGPASAERPDARTLELRLGEGEYFAGPFAKLIEESTGRPLAERIAEPIEMDGYRVELLGETVADGLRFVFDEPIVRDGRHLFFGSRARFAFQLQRYEDLPGSAE